MRFIGRGSVMPPRRRSAGARRSRAAQGSVLDPMVAIRCSITLEPDQSVTLDLVYGIGDSRDDRLGLVEKYQDQRLADRVFDLAWTHSQVVLRQLNASGGRCATLRASGQLDPLRQCLAARRAEPAREPPRAVRALGPCGVGRPADRALRIGDPANIELVRHWCRRMPTGA
jgi:cyclic beta-1,2-glucan synthetase